MADTTRIGDSPARSTATRPRGYDATREVRARARVLNEPDNERTRRALDRLDRILASDEPLRSDVPRGYYLDILI